METLMTSRECRPRCLDGDALWCLKLVNQAVGRTVVRVKLGVASGPGVVTPAWAAGAGMWHVLCLVSQG